MSLPVQPLDTLAVRLGSVTTLLKANSQASVEFQGITTFTVPSAQTYHYSLHIENGKLRISLEDCGTNKQWCTSELLQESFIDSSNSIPDACVTDYVECFHELLSKPLESDSDTPRALQVVDDKQLRLEIYVKIQALMKSRVVTYTFHLEPKSVERTDILESKVHELQEEVKLLRAEATGKLSVAHEMQQMISDLRAEMKALREGIQLPCLFLARGARKDGLLLWRCESLKVVDGIILDLKPGVYQASVTVDFEGRSTYHMQLNKGSQLVCFTSGFQQLSMASIVHVNKGDELSVLVNGMVVGGYMTLALLAKLTV